MVCETKIVAEEQDALPAGGPQRKKQQQQTAATEPRPRWPASPSPGASPPAAPGAVGIREFQPAQREVVRRIFYEGIMERIPNTAFRGLKDQPGAQLLYGALAGNSGLVRNAKPESLVRPA
ncbi:UNVERIFIED_CONTAM: hypothetical protein K2H54_010577 [Gekko kuhli]